jgi:hypothetical protein
LDFKLKINNNKFRMTAKTKPRQGYLLIFFSLVILMLFIPLWVRTLEQDIIVRQDIVRWKQYTDLKDMLDSFLPFYLIQESKKGLGYFNFQVEPGINNTTELGYNHYDSPLLSNPIQSTFEPFFKDTTTNEFYPNADEYKLSYNYVSASVIPVPTTYPNIKVGDPRSTTVEKQLLKSRSADCHTYSDPLDPESQNHNAYPNCDFTVDSATKRINYTLEEGTTTATPTSQISYFYTVPTLGTGTSHDEICNPFKLELNDTYKTPTGTTEYVDPLDHPCNWNLIEKNQLIAIPLFTRDPKNPKLIRYQKPSLLTLRLRFPCTTLTNFCDPSDRPELKALENEAGSINWLEERGTDSGNKLIDYAIADFPLDDTKPKTFYRPFDEFTNEYNERLNIAPDIFVRNFGIDDDLLVFRNYELSPIRARFEAGSNLDLIFAYDPQSKISNLNLLTNITPFSESIYDNGDSDLSQRIIRFRNLAELNSTNNNYILFNNNPGFSKQILPSFLSSTNLKSETLPELYLIFKFENFPLASNPIVPGYTDSTGSAVNLSLKKLEWQILSDVPIGTNKSFINGSVKHPTAGWQRSVGIKSKSPAKGTVPNNPGTVFTN